MSFLETEMFPSFQTAGTSCNSQDPWINWPWIYMHATGAANPTHIHRKLIISAVMLLNSGLQESHDPSTVFNAEVKKHAFCDCLFYVPTYEVINLIK